jgi:hypothetical protein
MSSNQAEDRISVECSLCNSRIFSKNNLTENNNEYFCDECVMNTNCSSCGKGLTLTKKQVAQLGENVICKSCGNQPNSVQRSKQKNEIRFFDYIRDITKYIVSVLVFVIILAVIVVVLNMIIVDSAVSRSELKTIAGAVIPTLFFFYLFIRE